MQVDDSPIEVEVPEAGLHQWLKGPIGVSQSKGHSITLIKIQQPYSKCNWWLALLVHFDLPVPRPQVE